MRKLIFLLVLLFSSVSLAIFDPVEIDWTDADVNMVTTADVNTGDLRVTGTILRDIDFATGYGVTYSYYIYSDQGLIHYGDVDTSISLAADKVSVFAGNYEMITAVERTIGADEIIINEDACDLDFRVESDTDTDAIHVDGATGYAGISEASPTHQLDVDGEIDCSGIDFGDANLYTATVDLTCADINTLNASPKELVAAPGAGRLLEFVSAVLILDYGSEVLTESADNLAIEYDDGSAVAVSETIEATGFIDQAADTITRAIPVKDPIDAAADIVNKNLALVNTGDGEYGGNVSGDTAMRVIITYRVITGLSL